MKDKLEYFAVKFLVYVANLLPQNFAYSLMKFISRTIFNFEKRRRELTLKNLSLAFKEKDDKEIRKLAVQAYENVAITVSEILFMINDKLDLDSMITNKDEVIKKLNNLKLDRGIIFITGHFGNWELMAHFLAKNGYPMIVIGRKGNNELIENHFTTPFREKYGNKNVYKKNALISMVKTLKRSKNIGFMADQKAGGSSSIKVNFFSHPADTVSTIAFLKLKYNPLIIPTFAIREKDGKYKIEIFEPVEYIADECENEKDKIAKMTQKYNDILETVIRKYPEQWFWMHNRWRLAI